MFLFFQSVTGYILSNMMCRISLNLSLTPLIGLMVSSLLKMDQGAVLSIRCRNMLTDEVPSVA